MKKLIISFLILILVLLSVRTYAVFEKAIITNLYCTDYAKVKIFGNNTCYMKDCNLANGIWYCPCNDKITLTIGAIERDECHATFEYTQAKTNTRVVFPVIASWPIQPPPPEPGWSLDLSPVVKIAGFLIGGLIIIILIGIVVYFAIGYIKKELEEDERRNQ
jgi:hypothetical protein